MKKYLIKEINFFKGNRKYVQGPDIYDKITEYYLSGDEYIKKIYFKNKIINVPNLIFTKNKIPEENIISKLSCFGEIFESSKFISFFYLYNSDLKITESKIYDEESMKSSFLLNLEKKEIQFKNNKKFNCFSTLEKIISMKKMMCTEIFSSKKKWIFTSLTIKEKFNTDLSSIKISISNDIKNTFIVSRIFINDVLQGEITFVGKND